MMESKNSLHWPSVFLLILSALSAFFSFSSGFFLMLTGLMELFSGEVVVAESTLMLAAGSIFLGVLFLPAGYFSLMRILDRPARFIPLHRIPTYVLILAWIASASLGVFLDQVETVSLLTIPLNLLTISLPVWILIRIGQKGLHIESPERRWGTMTIGMTLVPLLIGFAEISIIVIAGTGLIFWMILNPSMLRILETLGTQLMYVNDPETIIKLLAPYLFSPAAIFTGLIFFSLLVPLIEEFIKPLGVWLSPKSITSREQGFAIGILCGAAYALVESLGMAPGFQATGNVLSIVRAGTDLLHIVTAGLMGWALAGAWHERKFIQLGLTYLVVVLLHGLWNALSLASAAEVAMTYLPNPSPWLASLTPVSFIGLAFLSAVNLALLILANRKNQPLPEPFFGKSDTPSR